MLRNERADHNVTAPSEQDRVLLKRIREGDTSAYTSLVLQYLYPVTRFAYNIIGTEDAAEDLAQNAFVQLWERRASLEDIRSIKAYLFRIVRNTALNERKANSVRKRYQDLFITEMRSGSTLGVIESPENLMLTTETIQAAINELPGRRRTILRLRIEEELSHAEIGEILGLSPQAAQVLAGRALADLRKKLRVFD